MGTRLGAAGSEVLADTIPSWPEIVARLVE
jgi:hypothetical protein